MIEQGQIYMIDLEPSKGTETKKLRPYLIVSNNSYQKVFNTVIIAPISSSRKYLEPRFSSLPFFVEVPLNSKVTGTILLQHLRSIDPSIRIKSEPLLKLDKNLIEQIKETIIHEF
ncbi:toxin-antitoxin system toxin component MazF [Secundilactobacillus oryzae JCM 18671]|uniref:Toxin-antitoxin system toxin component MazF n=1 Tax=Secundilactobacillus oryzae JCM 18671 TaxID=1291743 RepID=A0A081BGF9_9LACO|nr:type II toxin-antitoxin system PemK/MazF family toxin [Secundilactobacillus oryzae]GAK47127.1 toxin-antitoxin system toxin component MazF [Secundilactobacillus oryzae JCM 18671]